MVHEEKKIPRKMNKILGKEHLKRREKEEKKEGGEGGCKEKKEEISRTEKNVL